MYHNMISRKSLSHKEELYDFREHRDSILNITYNMLKDKSNEKYQHYYLYEKAFIAFSQEILCIQEEINYKQPILDISNDVFEDDKKILFSDKSKKSVLEMMKKRDNK
jgi:hypothetical protein